ncbi:alpha/beta hydrolase [Halosolutus gelatinilyticus]|uniref:alpha/beta hydrolase n=1 Tax=Halosolutus gelatinilyticus TaxID=2931975 RepID=UPI001FF19C81|nr:alpha/beta fold hydrolase [Halosolutus gelatinilyticus]
MTGSGGAIDPHGDEEILIAGAPAAAANAALVLLHGRGATAQGVVNLFEPVYRHGLAVLAPRARRSRWLPNPIGAPIADNEPWLGSAVDRVGAAVETAADAGVPADRTVIVGFSQGACVAAEFALRRPRRLGGLFVLSGTIPEPSIGGRSLPQGSLSGTPVRLECGDDDPYVPIDRVRESARVFEAREADVTTRIARGAGHAVTDEGFAALGAQLETLLEGKS